MKREIWDIWMENKERRTKDLQKALRTKKIKKETEVKILVDGHIEKANHNLKFVKQTLKLEEFNDWAIVSSYYAIYHASLALCALKGYSTKDHLVTLLILIDEFYEKGLGEEEIKTLGMTTFEKEEVLYYVQAKEKRTKASYSTQKIFDKTEAENVREKAIEFVNKAKEIIDEN